MTYWDKVAETRWGRYIIDVEKAVIVTGLAMVEKPAVAVDIGCGSGRWSKLLADLGWKLICQDVDSSALTLCQSKVPQATCVLIEPSSRIIHCESNGAELALCIEVAQAMEAAWFPAELQRILKIDGLFIGVHVNRLSWRGIAVRVKYRVTKSHDRKIYYTSSYTSWKQKITNLGFELIHEEGFCWFPFARDSNSFLVPFFSKLERFLGLHRLVSISPWIVFIARKRRN